MLNGLDPIFVFHLKNKGATSWLGDLLGLNSEELDSGIIDSVGVPIPIPLNEQLTGIMIDNETRSISIQTTVDSEVEKNLDGTPKDPTVVQNPINSDVHISMSAQSDSPFLTVFIAIMELTLPRLATAEYGLSYMHGSTVIFDGLLSSFSTSQDTNTTLVKIELVISNAKKAKPTAVPQPPKGLGPIDNPYPNTGP